MFIIFAEIVMCTVAFTVDNPIQGAGGDGGEKGRGIIGLFGYNRRLARLSIAYSIKIFTHISEFLIEIKHLFLFKDFCSF